MAPGSNTSKAHPAHKAYPYLLRGLEVVCPNQVWSTDINKSRQRSDLTVGAIRKVWQGSNVWRTELGTSGRGKAGINASPLFCV